MCGSDCCDVTSIKFCGEIVVASIKAKFLVNRHLLTNITLFVALCSLDTTARCNTLLCKKNDLSLFLYDALYD